MRRYRRYRQRPHHTRHKYAPRHRTLAKPIVFSVFACLVILAFVGVQPWAACKNYTIARFTGIRMSLLPTNQEVEDGVIKKINEYRSERGLPLYIRDPFLDELAKEHAQWLHDSNYKPEMVELGTPYFPKIGGSAHTGFEKRVDKIKATLGATQVSEGVAFGDSASELFNSWLSSGFHCHLIEDGIFRRVGIGVVGRRVSLRDACLIVCD